MTQIKNYLEESDMRGANQMDFNKENIIDELDNYEEDEEAVVQFVELFNSFEEEPSESKLHEMAVLYQISACVIESCIEENVDIIGQMVAWAQELGLIKELADWVEYGVCTKEEVINNLYGSDIVEFCNEYCEDEVDNLFGNNSFIVKYKLRPYITEKFEIDSDIEIIDIDTDSALSPDKLYALENDFMDCINLSKITFKDIETYLFDIGTAVSKCFEECCKYILG